MPWHTSTVKFWLGDQALLTTKVKATATLCQKVSHINMLVELDPPLIPGPRIHATNLAHGLGGLYQLVDKVHILPTSFLITLKNLHQPQVIHAAVQFQTQTGLRAGQMSMILPTHLVTGSKLWLPPFKHCGHAQILDITHVPAWLIILFLSFKTSELPCSALDPCTIQSPI